MPQSLEVGVQPGKPVAERVIAIELTQCLVQGGLQLLIETLKEIQDEQVTFQTQSRAHQRRQQRVMVDTVMRGERRSPENGRQGFSNGVG